MGCKKFKLKLKKYKQKHFKKWINLDTNNKHNVPNAQAVYRFFESKIFSDCFTKTKFINKINDFSEVRELCFDYLQKVVYDNCMCNDCSLSVHQISNLSVELEQYALLACLELRKYQKSICKIINEIEKSTQQKEIHEDIKKLLPELIQSTEPCVKTEKPSTENYSQIPVISSTRNDQENQALQREEEVQDTEAGLCESPREEIFNNDPCNNLELLQNCERDSVNAEMQVEEFSVQVNENQMGSDKCCSLDPASSDCNKPLIETSTSIQDVASSILASRNQLQESVTECLKLNEQERTEKEKAYIAKILDSDSSDDNSFDNLSGGESESKENVDANFLKSLEKMRELFSTDDEVAPVVPDKPKTVTKRPNRKPRPTIWKHEKVIQLHKYSMLSSEMTFERHRRNKMMFLELFGDDSDEEHEEEYRCVDMYRTSCVERISRWVVKCLMPFYHNRRIIGREVFKTLAHHISETVIDKIQYPDEWTIRYFVTRFFPTRKKYVCEADVLAFQFD